MSILSNALSGLNAAQIGVHLVSNNVAHMNVEGFSRQEANEVSRGNSDNSRLSTGQGVEVSSIRRVTDDYLNNSVWSSNSSYGFNDTYSNHMISIEQLMGNENLSISTGLDGLFNAFNSASTEPSSIAPRQQIIASAEAFSRRFNSLSANLDIQSTQTNEKLDGMFDLSNTLLSQVAQLNGKIVEGADGNVSALQDQRDEAMKQLSGLMEVNISRQRDGSMTVSMPNGQPVVLGMNAAKLTNKAGTYQINIANQKFTFDGDVGGKIGAVLSYQEKVLDSTKQKLGALAKESVDAINTQLKSGINMRKPAGKGTDLFKYDALDPAGSLHVVAGFEPEDLALASVGAGMGDNGNLIKLITLKENSYDKYNGLVGGLAIQSAQAAADANASKMLATNALNQRDSVSGVNKEDEAGSLMKYQQSYRANAKVISAADQLFNTLLNMM